MSVDENSSPPPEPQKAAQAPPAASPEVLYPHVYTWYVLVSALDVMFTWMMFHIYPQYAKELNFIAEYVMLRWELPGMVVFKFLLVGVVVCICEFVGRQRYRLGRGIAVFALSVSCIPVLWAAAQMLWHGME